MSAVPVLGFNAAASRGCWVCAAGTGVTLTIAPAIIRVSRRVIGRSPFAGSRSASDSARRGRRPRAAPSFASRRSSGQSPVDSSDAAIAKYSPGIIDGTVNVPVFETRTVRNTRVLIRPSGQRAWSAGKTKTDASGSAPPLAFETVPLSTAGWSVTTTTTSFTSASPIVMTASVTSRPPAVTDWSVHVGAASRICSPRRYRPGDRALLLDPPVCQRNFSGPDARRKSGCARLTVIGTSCLRRAPAGRSLAPVNSTRPVMCAPARNVISTLATFASPTASGCVAHAPGASDTVRGAAGGDNPPPDAGSVRSARSV